MPGTMPAYIRDALMKHMVGLQTYTPPVTVYAAACKSTGDGGSAPTASAAGTEFDGTNEPGYGRVALTLADLFTESSGVDTTAIDIIWPQNTGVSAWPHCGYVEFYDSFDSSGSNNRRLPWLVVGSPVACPANQELKVPAGSGTETGS
jgi:hypothetical protein